MSGARRTMRPARGPQCRMRSSRTDKRSSPASAETAGRLRARIERARPARAMAPGTIEEDHRRGKTTVIHEAPENPTAQLGSAGFLRLLRSPAGPVRCGRGRAVLTALRLDNARQHRETGVVEGGRGGGREAAYSILLTRAAGTARNGLKAVATLARKPLLKLPSSSAFGS